MKGIDSLHKPWLMIRFHVCILRACSQSPTHTLPDLFKNFQLPPIRYVFDVVIVLLSRVTPILCFQFLLLEFTCIEFHEVRKVGRWLSREEMTRRSNWCVCAVSENCCKAACASGVSQACCLQLRRSLSGPLPACGMSLANDVFQTLELDLFHVFV